MAVEVDQDHCLGWATEYCPWNSGPNMNGLDTIDDINLDIDLPECGPGQDGKFILRDYQKEISAMGVRQNIIVCLPTGSGKTMIAVSIMRSPEFKHEVQQCRRKIIFAVNTVQLAEQQGAYIKEHSDYKVMTCTGDKTSSWSAGRWKEEINSYEVLVMIAQICFDKMLANIINFESLALLVLDECHNATKAHKMNDIMTLYHKYVDTHIGFQTPRIIGLTATINKKKIKDGITDFRLLEEIAKLEKRMSSKAVGYHNIAEVQRFSTESSMTMEVYSPEHKFSWGGLLDGIKNLHNFLIHQKNPNKNLTAAAKLAVDSHLPGFSLRTMFRGNNSGDATGELNKVLMDVQELYDCIGPYACSSLVTYKSEYLRQKFSSQLAKRNELDYLNIQAVLTQFLLFNAFVQQKLVFNCKRMNIVEAKMALMSDKMEHLLQLLARFRSLEGSENQLLGLVFVQRRSFANAIHVLLREMSQEDPEQYGFIKSDVVTGTGNAKKDCHALRVSQSSQKEILDLFRERKINLIICTTVLEEGIDVPSCNLVVRFDEVQAYTSFIQSMGRARKRGAQFYLFVPSTSMQKAERNIQSFLSQHQIMSKLLISSDSTDRSLMFPLLVEDERPLEIQDFTPQGPSGPRITPSSCIALVYQYAQKGDDREVISWWTFEKPHPNQPNRKFCGYVWITKSPHLIGPVKGLLMHSADEARKAAFMEVCKILYHSGALDKQHLLPL